MVLCPKWKDKRDVMLLSTIHDDSMVEALEKGVKTIEKPKMIDHYNKSMGGVDQSDLYYGHSHRTVKWWKRVFFHLIHLTLVNAHILYNEVANKLTHTDGFPYK